MGSINRTAINDGGVGGGAGLYVVTSSKMTLPKGNDIRKISCYQPSSYTICHVGGKIERRRKNRC